MSWEEPLSPQSKCFSQMGSWNRANTSEVPRTVFKPSKPAQARSIPIKVERNNNPISRQSNLKLKGKYFNNDDLLKFLQTSESRPSDKR